MTRHDANVLTGATVNVYIVYLCFLFMNHDLSVKQRLHYIYQLYPHESNHIHTSITQTRLHSKPANSTTTKNKNREHVLPATTPHRCTPRSCHGPEARKGNTRPSHRRTNGAHGGSQNGWPSSRCDGWRTPRRWRHGWWASLLRGFSIYAFRKSYPNE